MNVLLRKVYFIQNMHTYCAIYQIEMCVFFLRFKHDFVHSFDGTTTAGVYLLGKLAFNGFLICTHNATAHNISTMESTIFI